MSTDCIRCFKPMKLVGTYETLWNPGKWTEFYRCTDCQVQGEVITEKHQRGAYSALSTSLKSAAAAALIILGKSER